MGQVLGPQEGAGLGPAGRGGGRPLACTLGVWEVPKGAGQGAPKTEAPV